MQMTGFTRIGPTITRIIPASETRETRAAQELTRYPHRKGEEQENARAVPDRTEGGLFAAEFLPTQSNPIKPHDP